MKNVDEKRGKGCLSGCAIGCLVILILLAVAGYAGYRFVKSQYHMFLARFERQGYSRVEQQFVETKEPVKEPTVFIGQTIKIRHGSERGIAMLCQNAEINGLVKGNVHFIGQELTIHKGAQLMYDLDVTAQILNVYGTVQGHITGTYQTINKKLPK